MSNNNDPLLNFRNATLDDLAIIVDIYNSTIDSRLATADLQPVSIESKLDWFHKHNAFSRPIWIITNESNQVIGWTSFQDFYGRPAYQKTAEISIYLDENYRGRGFGKNIISHAIQSCPSLGIQNLLAFIFEHNITSLSLAQELGFEEWGHLKEIALMDDKYYGLKIMGLKITP